MPKSAEQCKKIRSSTQEKILRGSMLYFARNGFSGTKIGELAKYLGMGQGTIYIYFKSKEDLFAEICKRVNREKDIKKVEQLTKLALPARKKIQILSREIVDNLRLDEDFAAVIALNTQMILEQNVEYSASGTTYQTKLYIHMAKLIEQGQKEGSVVEGNTLKLVDYYWGVVYLYSLKKLFTTQYEMIDSADLERTVLRAER